MFECLTGERAFAGEDASEILAGIIKGNPRWNALPSDVPPMITRLFHKCLNKDLKNRLHDIADARIEIEEVLSGSVDAEACKSSGTLPANASSRGILCCREYPSQRMGLRSI